ncbi:hypothetical protein NFI96_029477, partial [Prochilodus magdalenae]
VKLMKCIFLQLVEVKLQHKALYNGLESEHWWVLSDRCYSMFGKEYSGCAYAVACIQRFGTSIREAKVYLHESAITSVQNITLQTKVCKTNKWVFIDSDGHFWSHESSNTHSVDSGTLHLSHQATRTTSRLLIGFCHHTYRKALDRQRRPPRGTDAASQTDSSDGQFTERRFSDCFWVRGSGAERSGSD